MDDALAQRILDAVAAIPPGQVATYGDLASEAGGNSPRFAGWVLSHLAEDDLPWHRVLPSHGRPVPRLAERQLARLAEEGVSAVDGRVSMRRYRIGADRTGDPPVGRSPYPGGGADGEGHTAVPDTPSRTS